MHDARVHAANDYQMDRWWSAMFTRDGKAMRLCVKSLMFLVSVCVCVRRMAATAASHPEPIDPLLLNSVERAAAPSSR